jgi:16S rRNA (uracil1498-N3)-methyltransferase
MSRERRFFAADVERPTITLDPHETHHLVRVLRLRVGAEVSVFDGKGRAARARVVALEDDSVELETLSPEPARESSLSLSFAVAPPKGDRMALVVQKLTELGVLRIVPLVTVRGEVDRDQCLRNVERWQRVALESCKQCGRSLVPAIDPPADLAEVAARSQGRLLVADPGSAPLPARESAEGLLVLVGPEGGWSSDERSFAEARGLTRFALGPRTLRTETAAIAAASVLQFLDGDLSKR